MDEPQPVNSDATAEAAVKTEPATTPAHYAVVALIWLIVPVIGAPFAILTGVIALLLRKGKTRLSNGMASVAIVLGAVEAVYLWVL